MADEKITRKLSTNLAADVEGYTRLMRADEETTLQTLGEYREILGGLIARRLDRAAELGQQAVAAGAENTAVVHRTGTGRYLGKI